MNPSDKLCYDCPPVGYPTDETRCSPCPRRAHPVVVPEPSPGPVSEFDQLKEQKETILQKQQAPWNELWLAANAIKATMEVLKVSPQRAEVNRLKIAALSGRSDWVMVSARRIARQRAEANRLIRAVNSIPDPFAQAYTAHQPPPGPSPANEKQPPGTPEGYQTNIEAMQLAGYWVGTGGTEQSGYWCQIRREGRVHHDEGDSIEDAVRKCCKWVAELERIPVTQEEPAK